jgi:hypothetical protein
MRRVLWVAAAAVFILPTSSPCQEQASQTSGQSSAASSAPAQETLGEAARKAREQKKDVPKSAKVITNDDLPTTGGISAVGQGTPAPGNNGAANSTAAAAAGGPAATSANDETTWRKRFADLRHKLDQDKAELAVLQRELGVASVQNYGDPVKAMQQQMTREDINKKTAGIEAKQKAVDADQKAVDDAEDDLRKSGGDSGWAR